MIKAVIFDFFGVLITDVLADILAELRENDPDKVARIEGFVDAASNGSMNVNASRTAIASEIGISFDEYMDKLRNGFAPNNELMHYAERLRPKYKNAVLSNVGSNGLDEWFPEKELEKYFDEIVVSGNIGFAKPNAQAYEITAGKLGVRLEECVMIDDRQEYCYGAVGVGMQAIQYKSNTQTIQQLEQILAE